MLLRAFAKINLGLRILGRRSDGYHEIQTVLQTIGWFDEIRLDHAERFEFHCHGAPRELGKDASNLVVRAFRQFEKAVGETINVRIELVKNIPIGAGLGGGSADAAVTLLGLQRFCGKLLPAPELLRCLRELGSDVPFFAVGGRASGAGRGDEVIPLEDEVNYWLVVVVPEVRISSAEAYSWLTVSGESNTIEGFDAQFDSGRELGLPGNDFESVVVERHPVIGKIKNELQRLGARQAALSGSGSAIFGRFDREQDALNTVAELRPYGTVRVVRPLSRPEYLRSVFAGMA